MEARVVVVVGGVGGGGRAGKRVEGDKQMSDQKEAGRRFPPQSVQVPTSVPSLPLRPPHAWKSDQVRCLDWNLLHTRPHTHTHTSVMS